MAFPEKTVKQAWDRAGGMCEKCGKKLAWEDRGGGERDAWDAWHKDSFGGDGLGNCQILCNECRKGGF
jgi:hypothetical protein